MVSGLDVGAIIVDGTHCPVRRPSEKTVRRMVCSGKKKRFTYSTTVYTNTHGMIIQMLRSSVGSICDITLFRENPMLLGKWDESRCGGNTPE